MSNYDRSVTWHVAMEREEYRAEAAARSDRIADSANRGDWAAVLQLAAADREAANAVRIGSTGGYAPLHKAAWLNAPPSVVGELIAAGAWRTLRSTGGDFPGETPYDIAARLAYYRLLPLLRPAPVHRVPPDVLRTLEKYLHALIRERIAELGGPRLLRLPQLSVLTELAEPVLWCPVPGMYGGFSLELRPASPEARTELEVRSWCRIAGGSGRTHRITADGCVLVEEGWG